MTESADEGINLMAVGDIMTGCAYFHSLIGDSIPHLLADPDTPVLHERVVNKLNEADILFGNLECVISEEFDITGDGIPPSIMGPVESIRMLEAAGFDVLNLANNHILDHGPSYVTETIRHLDSASIDHIGNPLADRNGIVYEVDGIELEMLGYYLPDLSDRAARTQIRSEVSENDSRPVVVSLHWGFGGEHLHQPSPEQVSFARKVVESGADVVLGHHSHTFQPIEIYNGDVIAYSLGNFVFDQWRVENRKSGILSMEIAPDEVRNVTVIPTEQVNYQVGFDNGEFLERVLGNGVGWESPEEYRKAAFNVRRAHELDVIKQYARHFYHFPLGFHKSTMKRWSSKLLQRTFK